MAQELLVLITCIFLLCSSPPFPSHLHFKMLLILHFNLFKVLMMNFTLINHKVLKNEKEK